MHMMMIIRVFAVIFIVSLLLLLFAQDAYRKLMGMEDGSKYKFLGRDYTSSMDRWPINWIRVDRAEGKSARIYRLINNVMFVALILSFVLWSVFGIISMKH